MGLLFYISLIVGTIIWFYILSFLSQPNDWKGNALLGILSVILSAFSYVLVIFVLPFFVLAVASLAVYIIFKVTTDKKPKGP